MQAVERTLAELPDTYRTVLVLRLVNGFKPAQIAHTLGRSPETVRTQLHRGLSMLRGGKCWSSPVFAAGQLYVRSTIEAARLDLTTTGDR